MTYLLLRASVQLVRFDYPVARGNFVALHRAVRNYPVRKHFATTYPTERICHAIDLACIWYYKRVLCLQRSAATACLLKQYGIAAQLVIGAQPFPFKAHAWVEVDGRVVNDKPYIPEIYRVLERC